MTQKEIIIIRILKALYNETFFIKTYIKTFYYLYIIFGNEHHIHNIFSFVHFYYNFLF